MRAPVGDMADEEAPAFPVRMEVISINSLSFPEGSANAIALIDEDADEAAPEEEGCELFATPSKGAA